MLILEEKITGTNTGSVDVYHDSLQLLIQSWDKLEECFHLWFQHLLIQSYVECFPSFVPQVTYSRLCCVFSYNGFAILIQSNGCVFLWYHHYLFRSIGSVSSKVPPFTYSKLWVYFSYKGFTIYLFKMNWVGVPIHISLIKASECFLTVLLFTHCEK